MARAIQHLIQPSRSQVRFWFRKRSPWHADCWPSEVEDADQTLKRTERQQSRRQQPFGLREMKGPTARVVLSSSRSVPPFHSETCRQITETTNVSSGSGVCVRRTENCRSRMFQAERLVAILLQPDQL